MPRDWSYPPRTDPDGGSPWWFHLPPEHPYRVAAHHAAIQYGGGVGAYRVQAAILQLLAEHDPAHLLPVAEGREAEWAEWGQAIAAGRLTRPEQVVPLDIGETHDP